MKDLREQHATKLGEAQAIVDKAKAEGRGNSPEELAQFDALIKDANAIKGTLERDDQLRAMTPAYRAPESQRAAAATGTGVQTGRDRNRGEIAGEDTRGYVAARILQALAIGRGQQQFVMEHAAKMWGESSPEYLALGQTDFTAGGALVRGGFVAEVIEMLRAASAVRKLNPTLIPMNEGTQSIPRFSAGSAASYQGENKNLTKTEPSFGQVKFSDKNLGAVVPVSNSLIRTGSVQVDQLVRNDLVAALTVRSDQAFIRDDGTADTPRGLRYAGASGNRFATAGTTLANIRTDIRTALNKLMSNNVRMIRPGWIMSARDYLYLRWSVVDANSNLVFAAELDKGLFAGYAYAYTTNVPTNLGGGTESELYLADFADVIIAEADEMMFKVSDEAAYDDGGTLKSAFSLDQTVIRVLEKHDFGVRHEESVAVVTGVTYGA